MKIAIIADIHGRYEALIKFMEQVQQFDIIVNLGDVAGFEPDVNSCYDVLKRRNILNIIGNHEVEVLQSVTKAFFQFNGASNYDEFNDSIEYGINFENVKFIRTMRIHAKVEIEGVTYSFCHGFPLKHKKSLFFEYLSDDNIFDFHEKYGAEVIFCGHLHRFQKIRYCDENYAFLEEVEKPCTIPISDEIIGINVGMLSREKENPTIVQYALLDTTARKIDLIM